MAARGRSTPAAWLQWALACGLLSPGMALAAASAGTGGGASAPGPVADAHAQHRQQRARCLDLQVAAVRAECLRQADRDLARRLAPAAHPASAAPAAASAPTNGRR
jgi:hypothetical protein